MWSAVARHIFKLVEHIFHSIASKIAVMYNKCVQIFFTNMYQRKLWTWHTITWMSFEVILKTSAVYVYIILCMSFILLSIANFIRRWNKCFTCCCKHFSSHDIYLSMTDYHLYDVCFVSSLNKNKYSSKHKTFVKHLYNVGPMSLTLVQHCINVIQK